MVSAIIHFSANDLLEQLASDTDAILENLDDAARNMNEFSRQIRQDPGVLLKGRAVEESGVGHAR